MDELEKVKVVGATTQQPPLTCHKCGLRIWIANIVNGLTICDWCKPK